ncbi:hypothetical protein BKH43_05195 [Helicobacter sp. 13S00401-1]|uniref:PD-(D/E)XK nuclease family protein n=1 Tax=Helicobacter sp. 13S00401-1 TaxID=1905758 RepID=UPI000BA529FF|nr:PD-(D/E)XK nuclease family protein [Helicobacter sp. 13S00401-1]PAF50298.1 hypothetical protein BKH43_05195 [Helicobacter sp. 13S00401-1]
MSAFYTHFIEDELYRQDLSTPNFKLFEYEDLDYTSINSFLPQTILLGEFFKKITYTPSAQIPKSLRRFLISDALLKLEKAKSSKICGFEHSFMAYLENSNVLLNFLDEIRSHNLSLKDLKDIALSDVYGDYTLHLEIVDEVYQNYKNILRELNLSDGIYEGYSLLESYIDNFKAFHIELEGFITPLELEILNKIALKKDVFLYFETDMFNINHFGFIPHKLEINHKYAYHLKTKKLDSKKSTSNLELSSTKLFYASSKISQVAFCLEEAYSWLKEIRQDGGSENDYAVILCNEDFTRHLEIYDEERIFNFARGRDLTNTKPYMHFERVCKEFLELSEESSFKHEFSDEEAKQDIFTFNVKSLEVLLQKLFEGDVLKEAINILSELKALFKIRKSEDFRLLLKEFMESFCKVRLSDANGGPIKVIGVLETRNIKFKKALLVDFSANFVPNVKTDDLFLNSYLRGLNKIPTMQDKQNLQKHHYLGIFKNVKELKVSFLKNEESMGSLMLEELGLDSELAQSLEDLSVLDFSKQNETIYVDDSFEPYTYKHISASALKTYSECTRKFYYRYIEGLRQEESKSLKAGTNLHAVLESCLLELKDAKDLSAIDASGLQEALSKRLDFNSMDSIDKFETKKNLFFMQGFFESEARRFKEGIKILELERSFEGNLLGKEVSGKIDRIDRLEDTLYIIDYKLSKSKETPSPLQLAFYALCIETLECLKEYRDFKLEFFYYMLLDDDKTLRKIESSVIEEGKEILKAYIKELGSKNVKAYEDKDRKKDACGYCEFSELCGL